MRDGLSGAIRDPDSSSFCAAFLGIIARSQARPSCGHKTAATVPTSYVTTHDNIRLEKKSISTQVSPFTGEEEVSQKTPANSSSLRSHWPGLEQRRMGVSCLAIPASLWQEREAEMENSWGVHPGGSLNLSSLSSLLFLRFLFLMCPLRLGWF